MNSNKQQLLVSLTDPTLISQSKAPEITTLPTSPSRVGGKASSLAKLFSTPELSSNVPKAYALSVDFFQPWIDEIKATTEFKRLLSSSTDDDKTKLCTKLQQDSYDLPLSKDQKDVVQTLVDEMNSSKWNEPKLAAVRSSAPEEDGEGASFAGAFDTELGVAPNFDALLKAIHNCFASLWDYRVLDYKTKNNVTKALDDIGFAVVVMEMIDSKIAGVAFSANPLNSDRDELVVDSSYGLGESVVDGSVTADRYIVDKLDGHKLIKETLGEKGVEKRLGSGGGVVEHEIKKGDKRRTESSLSKRQLQQLSKLVCAVEETYGMPMDVEWAFIENGGNHDNGEKKGLELKLLQARPITTLYTLDEKMMTKPGEKRVLYMDGNIMSEATTTTPFTTMDLDFWCKCVLFLMGGKIEDIEEKNISFYSQSPNMPMFNSSTRQYANMSLCFKYFSPDSFSKMMEMMDPYAASIFKSSDCDREKYRAKKLPKGCGLMDAYKLMREIPMMRMAKTGKKFKKNPSKAKEDYLEIYNNDTEKLEQLLKERESGQHTGTFKQFGINLCVAVQESVFEEISAIFSAGIMDNFKTLDKKRRDESVSKEEREEYDHLLGGYIGDGLMALNIALYNLAQKLPMDVWKSYEHESMKDLAIRIENNLDATKNGKEAIDLPKDFLDSWMSFMNDYGFDGQDQLFMSCPRYQDSPELLLSMLRVNAVGGIKDPSQIQQEQVEKRRAAQLKQENDTAQLNKLFHPFALSKIKKRNEILEHVMWMRNSPKLRLARIAGILRADLLRLQDKLIAEGILEEKGDIFHLNVDEVDQALSDPKFPAKDVIRPRKVVYKRALNSKMCPLLVDSRCRILQPDPPSFKDGEEPEPGTLIGSAIAPGVATGRVRILHSPNEKFEAGEILCATVTGPAWTPLFASASAVVLQIGGVLQHGALCAREYGKPAVSNIDVHTVLKDGMNLSVDGNTGIVKILDEGNEKTV